MKPDATERIAVALEALDQRLSSMDVRFVRVEGHLADAARAGDEGARAIESLTTSMRTVQEAIVALADKLEQHTDVMQNFITETQRLRTTSQQLISEVRRKGA